MADPLVLACVCASALAGTGVGFVSGLIPGLHMNNVAAIVSAYGASIIALLGGVTAAIGSQTAGVLVASFLCAAMIAHVFSESVTSTYVGIPAGDIVSVLPAHRLARAGLGRSAVRASMDGALTGVIVSTAVLVPLCLVMGRPVGVYGLLKEGMGILVILFSAVLVFSEGARESGWEMRRRRARRVIRGLVVFGASGLLGLIVLKSDFFSRPVPDLPWMTGVISRDSLLLPLFAGLFGVPSLILSFEGKQVFDIGVRGGVYLHAPRARDILVSFLGGTVVGWMPGMTSGAACTLCAPTVRETVRREDVPSSLRFIWLYSSISASGAVLSLGALFTILKARSGTMSALTPFLASHNSEWPTNLSLMLTLVVPIMISAVTSHSLLLLMDSKLPRIRRLMGSRAVALSALVFILSLTVGMTGTRGTMTLFTAISLGLIPPLSGVRRIQLMGCLLVPIAVTLFSL